MSSPSLSQEQESAASFKGVSGPAEADRIRRLTFKSDLERIDRGILASVRTYANRDADAIARRLAELDEEWPVERAFMAGAGGFVWLGLILGGTVNRRLTAMSAVAAAMLIVFAIFGWVPPVVIMRRFGLRTRGEINRERIALKVLRGDFDRLDEGRDDPETRVDRAMKAAYAHA